MSTWPAADEKPSLMRLLRKAVRAPFTRRAWAEAAYGVIGFPLGVVGGVVVAVVLALGAGLTLSLALAVVGVLLLIAAPRLARALGGVHCGLAAGLLGDRTAALPPFRRGEGLVGRLDARLRDGTGWRAAGGTALDPEVVTQLAGASHRAAGLAPLTGREREVLTLVTAGGCSRSCDIRSRRSRTGHTMTSTPPQERHVPPPPPTRSSPFAHRLTPSGPYTGRTKAYAISTTASGVAKRLTGPLLLCESR
ncbi:sensor domain-containing protein [Streptomyces sp. NPDC018584]|uniref:sensor domain-containing protein n=1 Tax=unclassified Streptomyces TaxID=2593676 RepID=UPI0037BC1CB4